MRQVVKNRGNEILNNDGCGLDDNRHRRNQALDETSQQRERGVDKSADILCAEKAFNKLQDCLDRGRNQRGRLFRETVRESCDDLKSRKCQVSENGAEPAD